MEELRMSVDELYANYVNKFNLISCLDFVKDLPDDCLDIVVTSPPYNMGNVNRSESNNINSGYKNRDELDKINSRRISRLGYSTHQDNLPYTVYCEQQRFLLKHLIRALKPTGAIFYNIKLRIYDGLIDRLPLIFDDLPIRQQLKWIKQSTISVHKNQFMTASEEVFFIVKNNGAPCYLTQDGITSTDCWYIPIQQDNFCDHPAIFPRELVRTCIRSIDNPDNNKLLIYDPYMGSGTTAIVADEFKYDWIGTDVDEEYIKNAYKRMENNKIVPEKNLDIYQNVGFREKREMMLGKKVVDNNVSTNKIII